MRNFVGNKNTAYPIRLLCIIFFILLAKHALSKEFPGNTHDPIDSLKNQLTQDLPDTLRIKTLRTLAIDLQYKQTNAALEYAKEALAICDKNNDFNRKRLCLNACGNIYNHMGNYCQALFCYLQALRLCDKLKKGIYDRAPVYNNIGVCYLHLKQHNIAKIYFLKVLNTSADSISSISEDVLLDVNVNLGFIALFNHDYKASLEYYKTSILKCKNNEKRGLLLLNMGIVYAKLNQIPLALNYYMQAFPYIKNNTQGLIAYYTSLSEIYNSRSDFKRAEASLMKAKSMIETSGVNSSMADVYENLTDLYAKKGDFKNAYLSHKTYKAIQDSLLNESTSKQIADIQKNYEIEKRDNEILVLSQQQQLMEEKSNNQRLLSLLLLLGAVIITIIGRNVILKQRIKNKTLSEEKALMEIDNTNLLHENTEAKYEVLKSKTNPHFLFNSLSTLSAIVARDQELARTYIKRFAELYRTILTTGENKSISLREEIEIVNNYLYLQKMRFKEGLELDVQINPAMNQYYIPPFSIQMAVENAIKHNIISSTKKLTITIQTGAKEIIISNNLQKKFSNVQSTATGQKNTTKRYELLSGLTPTYQETGAMYIVKLPLLTNN